MANTDLPQEITPEAPESESEEVIGALRRRAASEPLRSVTAGAQGSRRLQGGQHGGSPERMQVRDSNNQLVYRANGGEFDEEIRA